MLATIITNITGPPPERCDLCHSEDRHGALLCTTCAQSIGRLHTIVLQKPALGTKAYYDKPVDAIRAARAIATAVNRRSPSATSFNVDDFDVDESDGRDRT